MRGAKSHKFLVRVTVLHTVLVNLRNNIPLECREGRARLAHDHFRTLQVDNFGTVQFLYTCYMEFSPYYFRRKWTILVQFLDHFGT